MRESAPRARDLPAQSAGDAGEGRLRRLEAARVGDRRRRVGEEAAPRRSQALHEAPRDGRLAKVRAEAHGRHVHFIQRWPPGVAAAALGDGRGERVLDARLGFPLHDTTGAFVGGLGPSWCRVRLFLFRDASREACSGLTEGWC